MSSNSKPKAMGSNPLTKAKKDKDKGGPSLIRQKSSSSKSPTDLSTLIYMEFEIRGKVQKVHFRKYTQAKAKELGLKGWVKNTEYGTVVGCMEGPRLKIDLMKDWLRRTGSPASKIAATEFKNIKLVSDHTFEDFPIIK